MTVPHKPASSVKTRFDRLEALIETTITRLEAQAAAGEDLDLTALEKAVKIQLLIEKRNQENAELDQANSYSKAELQALLKRAEKSIKEFPDNA